MYFMQIVRAKNPLQKRVYGVDAKYALLCRVCADMFFFGFSLNMEAETIASTENKGTSTFACL